MEKQSLYFIAIIPPKDVSDAITAIRFDFADRFESRAALRVIPHVTLKAPFPVPGSAQMNLQHWFRHLTISSGPFQIELKNFAAFPNKHPVIFVQPVVSTALLSLQGEIVSSFRAAFPEVIISATEMKFKPHITVAYRDLDPARFREAWKEYQGKEYEAVFEVDSFHLLQHNGKTWNIIDTYHLK